MSDRTVPDRDTIARALSEVLWNASNHPTPSAVLGKSIDPLRTKCVDAVMAVLADQPTVAQVKAEALREAAAYIKGSQYGMPLPVSQVLSILMMRADRIERDES